MEPETIKLCVGDKDIYLTDIDDKVIAEGADAVDRYLKPRPDIVII